MKHRTSRRERGPQPSVADPRAHLLRAVLAFVRAAGSLSGVGRIALLGSLATDKPVPKDVDVLVTIDATMDLDPLARLGRRLKGTAQTINLGADIFLADEGDRYMGRICRYRECHPRVVCRALSCGRRQHLNDDLQIVTLNPALVSAPPIDLWPRIVARCAVPVDTQTLLLAKLKEDGAPRDKSAQEGSKDGLP
jgi:predicted nucleotidyltransferase